MHKPEPLLYLNIGLSAGPNQLPRDPSRIASDTLHLVAREFGKIYSCEILPGKDEPTLVLAVSPPSSPFGRWHQTIENLAYELSQDSIAAVHTGVGFKGLLGRNEGRETWDDSKFIVPRVYWSMW
jgi:hypothetical protein